MNLFKKIFLPLVISSCLSACTTNLELLSQKENILRANNDYNSYLALEYLQFSRNLDMAGSKLDANYFAKKGLAASIHQQTLPENPIRWGADKAQLEELVSTQKRLEMTSNPEIQKQIPIQLAHLNYLYDCWAAKESKPIFRAAELSKCKDRFFKLLEEIEYYIDDIKKDRRPKTILIEPEFERFEILFDFNNDKLSDKSNKDLIAAIKYLTALRTGGYRILLVGNADRVGSELYNKDLSFKRVQVVQNYLVKNGVAPDLMEIRYFGEDFPDILTKEGTQHDLNRTVGIYVLKGARSFNSFPLPLVENYIYKQEVNKARQTRGLK